MVYDSSLPSLSLHLFFFFPLLSLFIFYYGNWFLHCHDFFLVLVSMLLSESLDSVFLQLVMSSDKDHVVVVKEACSSRPEKTHGYWPAVQIMKLMLRTICPNPMASWRQSRPILSWVVKVVLWLWKEEYYSYPWKLGFMKNNQICSSSNLITVSLNYLLFYTCYKLLSTFHPLHNLLLY